MSERRTKSEPYQQCCYPWEFDLVSSVPPRSISGPLQALEDRASPWMIRLSMAFFNLNPGDP